MSGPIGNSTAMGGAYVGGYDKGPYLAKIIDHLDSEKMGALKVVLLHGSVPGEEVADSVEITARYLPSFFGYTPFDTMDGNVRDASSTQSSYGMWFVPPDVGTRVLVVFVEGDINHCYWIGCVPQPGINHMVPGIASSKSLALTQQQKTKLGSDEAPVLEVNRRLEGQQTYNVDKLEKPLHPFALRLATQGLLKDPIRGLSTSSARRSPNSNVYGISTPGPPVVGGKKAKAGSKNNKFDIYTSREGGTQFVMDDGIVVKDPKTQQEGITDELVRIRTRTGHQILLHNSQDLIYIANSRGTAWIEMTSDGKIDIFAADSVSIHSEEDFNFRADRDINIEAGNNLNFNARGTTHFQSGGMIEGFAGADVNWTAKNHFNVSVLGRIRMTSTGISPSPTHAGVLSGIDISAKLGNINIQAATDIKMQSILDITARSAAGVNIQAGGMTTISSTGSNNLVAGVSNYITATTSNILDSKVSHIERSALIDMNGLTPAPVNPALASTLKAVAGALTLVPEAATSVSTLTTHNLTYREKDKNATKETQQGWEQNNYYRISNVTSIMKRIPAHEPWDYHENIDPSRFTPDKTNRGG